MSGAVSDAEPNPVRVCRVHDRGCPSISVIIPLFNKRHTVIRAISSAESQTLSPCDIVVVDDGSTDGSGQFVSLTHPEIRLISQNNTGEGAARNAGLSIVETEWVAFLDADDLWLPNHLQTLHELVINFPQADFASTSWTIWDHQSRLTIPHTKEKKCFVNYFRQTSTKGNSIFPSSSLVKTKSLRDIGGFSNEPVGCDTATWVRLALNSGLAKSSLVTCIYVRGVGGIMDSGAQHRPASGSHDILDYFGPSYKVSLAGLSSNEVSQRPILRYMKSLAALAARGAILRGDYELARRFAEYFGFSFSLRDNLTLLACHSPRGLLNFALNTRRRIKRRI